MVQCFDRNHDHDNDQMEKLQESKMTKPFLGRNGCLFINFSSFGMHL